MVISEIYLYDFYPNGGGTDKMIEVFFSLLNADEIGKTEIVDSELREIKEIFSSAKTKRYNKNSRALAEQVMFFDVIYADGVVHRMYTSCESGFFDIDEKIFYSVENKDHKLWIKQFREKYKKISK